MSLVRLRLYRAALNQGGVCCGITAPALVIPEKGGDGCKLQDTPKPSDLGFRVYRIEGLGCKIKGLGFRV